MATEVAGILIVEDDALLRARIAESVAEMTSPTALFQAGSVEEGKKLLQEHQPQLVLLDVGLPDGSGLELLRYQVQLGLSSQTLILSSMSDEETIVQAIRLGAQGYLLKQDSGADLVEALKDIIKGVPPLSPSVAQCIMRQVRAGDVSNGPEHKDMLPPRQLETLTLLARGLTYRETANKMGIKFHTVSAYAQEIYNKLAANSRGEAVYKAREMGIL